MLRLKKPFAAVVLLALAASTALRFHSWWSEAAERAAREVLAQIEGWEEYNHAGRQLMTTDEKKLHDRIQRHLIRKGHQPRSDVFKRLFSRKIQRRERMLAHIEVGKERREALSNLRKSKDLWVRFDDNAWKREEEIKVAAQAADLVEQKQRLVEHELGYKPLTVCDRPAGVGLTEDFESLQKYGQCTVITMDKPLLLMAGMKSYGRTGNNLVEFLHALQMARDRGMQLGIMFNSWAVKLLTQMWMAIDSEDKWTAKVERAFCVKIFWSEAELEGWDVIRLDTKDLLWYRSNASLVEYMEAQEYSMRMLFRDYNTGEGHDYRHNQVKDMCSGVDALFGDDRQSAVYSVIHSRKLEGEPGLSLLRNVARKSRCDPLAALEMRPDYVTSILEPLGMMKYPIVFITDGQDQTVLERLLADPDLGPMILTVPEEACWLGGDLTLAIMSNVFIGNPASTFSGFIAKARMSLGFGHSHLFRTMGEDSGWETVCGDHCVFDQTIVGVMA